MIFARSQSVINFVMMDFLRTTLAIAILVISSSAAVGQLRLIDQYVKPHQVETGSFTGYTGYRYDGFELLHRGGRVIIRDVASNQQYFSFQDTSTIATEFSFRFFKGPKDEIPVVILMDVSADTSLGQNVFLMKEGTVGHAGYLKYAVDDYNFSSLALHAIFSYEAGKLYLTFDDADIIDFDRQRVMNGESMRFEIGSNYINRLSN